MSDRPKGSVGRLLAAGGKGSSKGKEAPQQPKGSVGRLRLQLKPLQHSCSILYTDTHYNIGIIHSTEHSGVARVPQKAKRQEVAFLAQHSLLEPVLECCHFLCKAPQQPKGSVGRLLAAGGKGSSKGKEAPQQPKGSVGRLLATAGAQRGANQSAESAKKEDANNVPRGSVGRLLSGLGRPPRLGHLIRHKPRDKRRPKSPEKAENGDKLPVSKRIASHDGWEKLAQRRPPDRTPRPPDHAPNAPAPSRDTRNKRKFKDVAALEVKKRRTSVQKGHWNESCKINNGIAMQIHLNDQNLNDEDLQKWVQWMVGQLPPRPGKSIATLDLSNNSVTRNGINCVCNFLQDFNIKCDQWNLSGNPINDEGLLRIARHITAETGPAQSINFDSTDVTFFGFQWLLTILSLHPLYPVEKRSSLGEVQFVPLWVGLHDTKIDTNEVEDFFTGGEFEILSCSVCLEKCSAGQCRGISGRKSNLVMHLGMDLSDRCKGMAAKMFGICSQGILQKERPNRMRDRWLEPRRSWVREEPQFLYEDSAYMVIMKPATWHCSSQDQGRALLQQCQHLNSTARKEKLHLLLEQKETPALHDYLILRFGADPQLKEVMREDCLYGMVHRLDVGTTGSLLVAKTQRSFQWAKEQIMRQALVRDYICLVHGTFAKNAKSYRSRGLIMAPIDKTRYHLTRRCEVAPTGQHAATHYECLAEFKSMDGSQYSLLHCRIITGRTHQIRVHCEHIGLPLVGDKQYDRNRPKYDTKLICNRPFLHKAYILRRCLASFCDGSNFQRQVKFVFSQSDEQPIVVWTPLASAEDLVSVLKQLKLTDWRGIRAEDLARIGGQKERAAAEAPNGIAGQKCHKSGPRGAGHVSACSQLVARPFLQELGIFGSQFSASPAGLEHLTNVTWLNPLNLQLATSAY
eukprot:symbB.v1.2.016894.t1/scaffold1302.1/size209015/2